MTVILAEAPIALYVADWGISPLTPCCQAATTYCDADHVCKGCYEYADPMFGDCWKVYEQRGWDTYLTLLTGVCGVPKDKAIAIVDLAKQRAAAA